jgi:hypothetical protein
LGGVAEKKKKATTIVAIFFSGRGSYSKEGKGNDICYHLLMWKWSLGKEEGNVVVAFFCD